MVFTAWSIFTRGQFWPSGIVVACVCVSVCSCVYQSFACPHDNLSSRQARITKFSVRVQNTLVKVPIVLGVIRMIYKLSDIFWHKITQNNWSDLLKFHFTKISARLQYLQCVNNGDTTVLHIAIDFMCYCILYWYIRLISIIVVMIYIHPYVPNATSSDKYHPLMIDGWNIWPEHVYHLLWCYELHLARRFIILLQMIFGALWCSFHVC